MKSLKTRLMLAASAALLAFNIVELGGLLYFTGGLQNPFSFLFLAPVLISATVLPIRLTIALGCLAVACASALFFYHLPLPWDGDDPLVLPPIYLIGVWLSILLAIGVTSLYAFQVTEEARQLSDALAATELVLTREQHLTQLDGLAAAAAHELGTPLSTIFLISRELEKTVHDPAIAGDLGASPSQATWVITSFGVANAIAVPLTLMFLWSIADGWSPPLVVPKDYTTARWASILSDGSLIRAAVGRRELVEGGILFAQFFDGQA